MADLALPDQIVERADGLLDRRGGVRAVRVVEVHVVGLQTAQRALDAGHDPASREAAIARIVGARHADLAGDDEPIAPAGDRRADVAFRDAVRVHVGGIEVIDTQIGGVVDECGGLLPVAVMGERLVAAEDRTAQADDRYLDAAGSQPAVAHSAPACSLWLRQTCLAFRKRHVALGLVVECDHPID